MGRSSVSAVRTLKEELEKDLKRWELRRRMIDLLDGRDEIELYPNR